MQDENKNLSAREAALKTLGIYRRKKAWSDMALNSVVSSATLSPKDIALTVQLVYGVLQNLMLCDYYASHFSNIELKKLQPRVLDILRLSIYQIVFLTKIPHNAAVNEAVSLTKKYANKRAAGYVNALLRKISKAASEGSLPEITGDTAHQLSIKYSHPEWLVDAFIKTIGAQETHSLLMHNNQNNMPITAQVNTLLTNVDEAISLLAKDGVEATPHQWLGNCIEFRGAGNITKLEAYNRGFIYVQDVAARLSVIAASPMQDDIVVDGCAAPGGKSFAAAILMKNEGHILACDIHAAKLRHIESGSTRMGINIIDVIEADVSAQASGLSVKNHLARYATKEDSCALADVVLADVPCSGVGIIRKKPEIRYKAQADISGLPEIQKQILTELSAFVKPGGVLLYSTCSVLRSENEDIIHAFLSAHECFVTESFILSKIGEVSDGMITLWPHVHGTDGFFICKMRRREG
ncbi:MAG: 16S rRNA (cytosine(967)-C(5))-methyltransferase RsmB [Oscillospiraceae bacterium]|nr:16S rRNA (cytosine(967)-C(5))-methyltransferase RsmB [Oscillospiraceae bacterium]